MTEIMDVNTEPEKLAQTTAPDTEPSGWMSPTGEIREGAPENIQALVEAKKWTNVGQLADAYAELEKFKGIGKHLTIPEVEDAEGWNDVYNQLGRPETSDKYTLDYEGNMELSEDLTGQFKQFAHGLGLTQKQFNEIVKFQLDAVGAQDTAFTEQLATQKEANIGALKQKYGEVNYTAKVTGARIIADSLGIYKTLEEKGLASDPDIIDMLVKINAKTSEDVITSQSTQTAEKSPLVELEELKQSDAYKTHLHPDHKKAVARQMELCQMITRSGQSQRPRT